MISVLTPPAELPVSLADAKAALLVDHDQDDGLILSLLAAATEEAERLAARSLVQRTVEMVLDGWPADGAIRLAYPPVQSVVSVTYYDQANTLQTMAIGDYVAVLDVAPPVVVLANGARWPSATLRSVSPIRVRYVAGYGVAGAVPARYKALILGLVQVDYEAREAMSNQALAQRERLQAALKLDWGWA